MNVSAKMAAPCNALRYDYCECRNDAFMRCTVCYNYYSHIVWLGRHRTIHDCQDGSTLQCIQILYVNRSIVTRMSCTALFVRTIIQMLRGSASADIGQRHNTRQWHNNRHLEALSHISYCCHWWSTAGIHSSTSTVQILQTPTTQRLQYILFVLKEFNLCSCYVINNPKSSAILLHTDSQQTAY